MVHCNYSPASHIREAEHFARNIGRSGREWLTQTVTGGYTGTGYVQALPDVDVRYTSGYTSTSPELRFQVNFVTTGTYIATRKVFSNHFGPGLGD